MAYTGPGYPNWLADEYPGMGGINTALKGYSYLLNDPGFKQLTEASASDPEAQQYQAGPMAGVPSSAAPGLFGRLMAANMGANVAGQAAQNQGQNAAQKERVQAGSDTANLMAGQQESELGLEEAQTKKATGELGGFASILNMLSNPKGMGANIMGAAGASPGSTPLSGLLGLGKGLFGKIMSMFSGVPGLDDLAGLAGDTSGAGLESVLGAGGDLGALGGSEGISGIASLFADLLPALAGA